MMFGYSHDHRYPHKYDHFDEALSVMGRHGGHHGHGHFFGGFGTGGHGGRFRFGRKLGSNGLQLVLLALLAEKPSHGYELIKGLDQRSGGFYTPSPGMIYPALTYLEELGHARVTADGSKKLYEITDEGRSYLEQNRPAVETILEQIDQIGARMGDVRNAFSGNADADLDESGGRHSGEMHQARRALKQALQSKKGCSKEEVQRISAILQHAADEILGSVK